MSDHPLHEGHEVCEQDARSPDRADGARMSDAAWAIQTLRDTERTDPASPFWEGWDAALAAVEVALRATPDRADRCADCKRQERLLDADPTEEWVADAWSKATPHPHTPDRAEDDPSVQHEGVYE